MVRIPRGFISRRKTIPNHHSLFTNCFVRPVHSLQQPSLIFIIEPHVFPYYCRMPTTYDGLTVVPPTEGYVVDLSSPQLRAQKLYTEICKDKRSQPDGGKVSCRSGVSWNIQLRSARDRKYGRTQTTTAAVEYEISNQQVCSTNQDASRSKKSDGQVEERFSQALPG